MEGLCPLEVNGMLPQSVFVKTASSLLQRLLFWLIVTITALAFLV